MRILADRMRRGAELCFASHECLPPAHPAPRARVSADVRCALVVGGLSLREQEAAMRTRPETVVATPGRIVDLLMNSQSVDLDDLAVLVLDEASGVLY